MLEHLLIGGFALTAIVGLGALFFDAVADIQHRTSRDTQDWLEHLLNKDGKP